MDETGEVGGLSRAQAQAAYDDAHAQVEVLLERISALQAHLKALDAEAGADGPGLVVQAAGGDKGALERLRVLTRDVATVLSGVVLYRLDGATQEVWAAPEVAFTPGADVASVGEALERWRIRFTPVWPIGGAGRYPGHLLVVVATTSGAKGQVWWAPETGQAFLIDPTVDLWRRAAEGSLTEVLTAAAGRWQHSG